MSRSGQPVYERSFGPASRAFDVPIRPDTRFLTASVTKTFTAAAIALLEKEKKLAITDGLETFLAGFPHAKRIKLWHLLAHQSGLANPDYEAIAAHAVSPDELIAEIGAQPLLFEPGSETRYSNAGYVVLARVVETVSGEPFGAFLERRIFAPLGMKGSGTLASGVIVSRLADGYDEWMTAVAG